jgi:lambda repressor-like predicted transcriptional regulator
VKVSKTADRERIARLRAAGLTVREIARATGISYQRASQILATEPVPDWSQATVSIVGNEVRVTSDAEPRIIHALIANAIKRQGKLVRTQDSDAGQSSGPPTKPPNTPK